MRSEWTGDSWRITVTDVVSLTVGTESWFLGPAEATKTVVRKRWFRWSLELPDGRSVALRGIKRLDAAQLQMALRRLALGPELAAATVWATSIDRAVETALSAQRWLSAETVASLAAVRPTQGLGSRVAAVGCTDALTEVEQRAVQAVDADLAAEVAIVNEQILESELRSRREFFGTIEKSPLTDEQARAVACFDNRVQVLAAAGSGKTSVMVARAAYAVTRQFVAADRILLLAFNKAAADELQERIDARFAAAGIDSAGIRASTFHAFGLEVIGAATGRKPRLASWVDEGGGTDAVLRIVDELSDSSPSFRYDWDLYRLLFASTSTDIDGGTPDAYDSQTKESGYRTFVGEVVKSHGERLIADFLYLSGVKYRYETPYMFDVADATHSQYRPDFYYPDIDVWHEHWALDRDGNPPPDFVGYAESMEWKRRLHAAHGTQLIETTFADVAFGDGLRQLQTQLEQLGVVFDWNPDRPLDQWAKPMRDADLARLVRTFMSHVKSNSLTPTAIDERLRSAPGLDGFRTRLFLRFYWQIHDAWQARLRADGSVDFDDMLIEAAQHLECGEVDLGYELVMVDEFQDVSRARARLVRALVAAPGRYLLAVGDDWQAINRFAGADLSVMTQFDAWFGPGSQLALTTTFRCPQTICDVTSWFVSKNPAQFNKAMRSAQPDRGAPVRVVIDDDPARALTAYLTDLSAAVARGDVTPGGGGRVTVDVLGRYNFNRDLLRSKPANLDVTFRTVHSSKGLEADYIVVPSLNTGTYGFPSSIADDPVLELAMPTSEGFPHAEERRLLYVALTRARREAIVIAPAGKTSPFVAELLQHPDVLEASDSGGGPATPTIVCPQCRSGTMVLRRGPYGQFLGCSTYPACRNTQKPR